jgi:nucleotide-binding universal stress UspA family protein
MSMLERNLGFNPVPDDGRRPFARICVGVNDSAASESAARYAISLVRGQPDAEVAFCYVLNVPRMVERAEQSLDDYSLVLRAARATAHLILARCRVLARAAGVFGRSYIRYGAPAAEIRAFADGLGADLIVIGNTPASRLHRFFNGSVRDELVATCSQPVLVVGADQLAKASRAASR